MNFVIVSACFALLASSVVARNGNSKHCGGIQRMKKRPQYYTVQEEPHVADIYISHLSPEVPFSEAANPALCIAFCTHYGRAAHLCDFLARLPERFSRQPDQILHDQIVLAQLSSPSWVFRKACNVEALSTSAPSLLERLHSLQQVLHTSC